MDDGNKEAGSGISMVPETALGCPEAELFNFNFGTASFKLLFN